MAGPKVTVHHDGETPSEELVRQAVQPVEVKDRRGRTIRLRKPGVLAQFQLVKAMGPESAQNTALMSMYMPLLFVAEVDGEPVFQPKTELQIEGLITTLDDDGLAAVMNGVQEHFAIGDAEDVKEAAKK